MSRSGHLGLANYGMRVLTACTLWALLCSAAHAQYPGRIEAPQKDTDAINLRATAVYEYTGDLKKPTASRLVPVAVWDGHAFQPGGVYLAQPEPLTVLPMTEYELEKAGVHEGLFVVRSAERLGDWWLALGRFRAEPTEQVAKLKPSKTLPVILGERGDPYSDHPSFARLPADRNQTGAGQSAQTAAANAPPVDPDRPILHQRTEPDSSTANSNTASSAPVDTERPTLQHHMDMSAVQAAQGTAPIDPDRPLLRHGEQAETETLDLPTKLQGAPKDMEQLVAISDPSKREPHSFVYSWANPDDPGKMQDALEAVAQKALAGSTATAPGTGAKAPATHKTTGKKKAPAAPSLPALMNESFHAYELSFGGGATLVFSAQAASPDGNTRYITLIAQPDFYGKPQILLKQITSEHELDALPRMRLVDAVDADGDNRAELLFDLMGRRDRQFAIYRIVNRQAEQVFTTGAVD